MKERILRLKKEKNSVILAHYYTVPEVQDIADFVGDSLALAQRAKETKADIILFAGVHFMAETAKILNPTKKVLIPDLEAGCSLADSCPAEDFKKFIDKHPDHIVLSYINCSAEVKALSDIIVTSGNAVKIVNTLPKDAKIIFGPDKNLGGYINQVLNRNMELWDGFCHVHHQLTTELLFALKAKYPDAKVIAHPECQGPVLALADFIGSTSALLNFVTEDSHHAYIVATETGILYEMQKRNPNKQFYIVNGEESCNCNDCIYMKKNSLEKIEKALINESPELILTEEIMTLARSPIEKMLSLSS